MRDNAPGTDNQQGSPLLLLKNGMHDPSETTRRPPTLNEIRAYFQGAIHDGTYNAHNQRIRIAQKGTDWLTVLKRALTQINETSWIYQEGKTRDVFVLETRATFLDFNLDPYRLVSSKEKSAYIRGFFDAEGGIPRELLSRFYIQLVQRDRIKLKKLKVMLRALGIHTGIIHNPSKRVDPYYWRMFVRAQSWKSFISVIGSWHPRKHKILKKRWMKI